MPLNGVKKMTDEIKVSFTKAEFVAWLRITLNRWENKRWESSYSGEKGTPFLEWVTARWDELTDDGDLRK